MFSLNSFRWDIIGYQKYVRTHAQIYLRVACTEVLRFISFLLRYGHFYLMRVHTFFGHQIFTFFSNSCSLILFRRLQLTLHSAYIIFFTAEESSYPILLHLTNYSNLLLSLEMLTVLLISPSPYTQCRIRTNA